MPLKAEIIGRIAEVDARDWDALDRSGHPFLKHAFLDALEATGCVGGDSGWIPAHLVVRDARSGKLVAAVPQYLKTHSWGEFVFDWSWAQSYQRSGLEYYPKQLSAIPFTPVTGPRFLLVRRRRRRRRRRELREQLAAPAARVGAARQPLRARTSTSRSTTTRRRSSARGSCAGTTAAFSGTTAATARFDDFLATFRADKRKKAKRERRKVEESGIAFRSLAGEDIDAGLWRTIFGFSERTFLRHGNGHYLNVEFLLRVVGGAARLGRRASSRNARARRLRPPSFSQGGGWLYGRYWGSAVQEDSLHFEACYYQGIEHCIEHGLQFFDPGTQGEHKLARGFEPTRTTSAHWLEHAGFRNAVARYLEREREAVDDYIEAARQHLPFQRTAAATATATRATATQRHDSLAQAHGSARCFSAGHARADRSRRPALRGRRPASGTPAGGLSSRHLSLVLGGPTHPVVVARSAHGAVPRRIQGCRGAWARRCATAGSA